MFNYRNREENKILSRNLNWLKSFSTCTLSDALDLLGIQGVITGISPIVEGTKLIGPVVTVKEITGEKGSFSLEDFNVGSIIEIAKRDHVIFFDLEGEPISTWGELATRAAMKKGIAGVVVNGGVRDVEEIKRLKFPVFARHRVPTSGKTRVKIVFINKPIKCKDILIQPDDIIVGDSNGILILPSARVLEIFEKAKELNEKEKRFEVEIEKGASFTEIARKLHHL